jgi:mRNA interferase MazF
MEIDNPNRYDIFLVSLDPVVGSEIKKTRPCVIVSPNEINNYLRTVIVAPMTTKGHPHPVRVTCTFQAKQAKILLDQIRTIDKIRLVKKLGSLSPKTARRTSAVLFEMFQY